MNDEKKDALAPASQSKITKEIKVGQGGIVLATVEDAINFAKWNQESGLLPDHIKNPKQAFAIMARGAELGLKPHAAWRWIYMTKAGKMSMESKGMLAVCQASPDFVDYREWIENEEGPDEGWVATASAKRRNRQDQVKTFSYKDALRAKLVGDRKSRSGHSYDSTYTLYLKDMLLARARARVLDIQFSDLLSGIQAKEIAEEVENRTEGELQPSGPSVTVSDPLLDEVSAPAPPAVDAETAEVIAGQVEEIFPPSDDEAIPEYQGEVTVEEPEEPQAQACQGCGTVYHVDRKACPSCGVKAGEGPPPPPDEADATEAEAQHKRSNMGLTSRVQNPPEDPEGTSTVTVVKQKPKEPDNPFEKGRERVRKAKKGQGSLLDK